MSGFHTHALYRHEHSVLHDLPAQVKVTALVLFVAAVVATPREAFWAFGFEAALLVGALAVARIPFGFVARRLLIEVPFMVFAILMPFLGVGDRTSVLGVSLSIAGLWGAWTILAKGTLGLVASVLMAATTEIPDILDGLERLRVPRLVTAIAGFMVRYLDVIAGELRRMRVAMIARGYDPTWVGQAGPIAASAGALFVRSYERGERVHQAMLARGYTGVMPPSDTTAATPKDWMIGSAIPLLAWVFAITALMVR
ncbi:MAG: cobalt ECF transporter T component CbiQ [Actinobacteria bacterium]|nr:cobalt ECF transporter T component CbiQ [Actinomycetota bacterium]